MRPFGVSSKLKETSCILLGGGPSLKGFNFSSLNGWNVVTINSSVFDFPNSKWFVTMDYTFLRKKRIQCGNVDQKNRRTFVGSSAKKVFVAGFGGDLVPCDGTVIDRRLNLKYDLGLFDQVVWAKGYGGIGTSFDDFRSSSDSGYSALQLAVILGFRNIYLMGFDFVTNGNLTHYHIGYGHNPVKYNRRLKDFVPQYEGAFADIAAKTKATVYSCSPISMLNKWLPVVNINDVISGKM